jgi:hypothetical protein
VLNAPSLPTPNPRKTYTLAAAILQVQRLPLRILAPFATQIASAIKRGLDGDLGREGKKGAAWESLGVRDLSWLCLTLRKETSQFCFV